MFDITFQQHRIPVKAKKRANSGDGIYFGADGANLAAFGDISERPAEHFGEQAVVVLSSTHARAAHARGRPIALRCAQRPPARARPSTLARAWLFT